MHRWINLSWSRGISHLFYLKNSTMYTPRYLKYLRFSEAFFSMGSPRLRKCYRQKCHVIRRVDHDALREITWSSSPLFTAVISLFHMLREMTHFKSRQVTILGTCETMWWKQYPLFNITCVWMRNVTNTRVVSHAWKDRLPLSLYKDVCKSIHICM